jgi:hypothetical protein
MRGGEKGDDEGVSTGRRLTHDGRMELRTGHTTHSISDGLSARRKVVGEEGSVLTMQWYVGGSFSVDATWLTIHQPTISVEEVVSRGRDWSYILESLDDEMQPGAQAGIHVNIDSGASIQQGPLRLNVSNPVAGSTRWKVSGSSRGSASADAGPHNGASLFTATLQIGGVDAGAAASVLKEDHYLQTSPPPPSSSSSSSSPSYLAKDAADIVDAGHGAVRLPPGTYWVVAWASVDGKWGQKDQGFPKSHPQTHLSNARTDRSYHSEKNGKAVKGRTAWPSDPMILEVGADGGTKLRSAVLTCAWWERGTNAIAKSAEGVSEGTSQPSPSIHTYTHTHIHTYTHTYIHTYTRIYVHLCAFMYET